MMLRPSAVMPSFETLIWEENLLAVWTNRAAALACKPSLFRISNFLVTLAIRSLVDVAVLHVDAHVPLTQTLPQFLYQDHRAVPPAGTAKRKGKSAFTFALVERQGKFEQCVKPVEKSARVIVLQHILFDFAVGAGFVAQLVDEIRVGQKTHVEDDVGVVWNAELVTEGRQKNRHAPRKRG